VFESVESGLDVPEVLIRHAETRPAKFGTWTGVIRKGTSSTRFLWFRGQKMSLDFFQEPLAGKKRRWNFKAGHKRNKEDRQKKKMCRVRT